MKSTFVFITFLFLSSKTYAQTELTFAYEAAVYVNAMSMSVPPLPLLEMKKGNTRLQGQYIQYDGSFTATGEGDYEGLGSAANFSYAFGKKWGIYASYMGTTIQSDLKLVSDDCADCITNDVNDVDASLHTVSVGLVYSLINKKRVKLPIFFGPTYTFGTITQTVIRYEGTGRSLSLIFFTTTPLNDVTLKSLPQAVRSQMDSPVEPVVAVARKMTTITFSKMTL